MGLRNPIKDRRGDISSPIIVVLITVAALAVAGMAFAWMSSVASRVSSQPSIVILGTPTLTPGTNSNLYIVVRNIGTSAASVTLVVIGTISTSTSQTINPGNTVSFTVTINNLNAASGSTYTGTLVTTAGTIQFTAYCQ